jgi:hypothetical protein
MKNYTLADANTHLDLLSANPEFAGHVVALRELIADDVPVAEIDFMTRGLFPISLIAVLVEAHRRSRSEPVIAA